MALPHSLMLLASGALVLALTEGVTPITKVLQMLESMRAKGIEEKKAEEVQYSTFQQWCSDTESTKIKAIEDAGLRIEKLEADIAQASADIDAMSERIAELDEDVARWQTDKKAAADVRAKEKTDYVATHADYEATVDACERAVQVIKQLPNQVPQANAMLQVHIKRIAQSSVVPASARKVLTAFLQEPAGDELHNRAHAVTPDEQLFYDAPEANAYESRSGGILAMIQELHGRFLGEQRDLEKEEMNAQHNFETLLQGLRDQVTLAEQEIGQKKKFRSQRQGDKATAEGDRVSTEEMKANDETYLGDLKGLCAQKATDFEARQGLRGGEIEALAKAIEIISSGDVAAERLPGGAAQAEGLSLAQAYNFPQSSLADAALQRAASFLATRAKATGSETLAEAFKAANEDPFDKVKKIIRDLITKLLEEAASEADHHGWCESELATNKLTRSNKAEAVDELTAEVEKLTAKIANLGQEISDLADQIEELSSSVVTATAERQEEKKANEEAIADAKQSQTAVAQALAVLRDFYAKAAQATALVQQTPSEDAPAIFDSAYTGQQGSSQGICGMLEVIESDFARLEADTDNQEAEQSAAFKKFVAEAQQNKAVAETERDHKTSKKERTEGLLASAKRSLEQTQAELDAALQYYEKLRPSCVDSGISWEERIAKRNEEMLSLKEAYKILSGEELPTLQAMKAEQIE